MKNFIYIPAIILLMAAALFGGCEKQYDEPVKYTPTTAADITADGYQIITIWELKQLYYNKFGISQLNQSLTITDNIAICGKVISDDYYGNAYRSMYIQDETSGIEIKLGKTSLQNTFKVGQTIYVKAKGLVLGDYRYSLSLGAVSTDTKYSNGYINTKMVIDNQILRGERTGLTKADTLVVSSHGQLRIPQDLGRLVRFENMTSVFGTGTSSNGTEFSRTDIYPSFLEQLGSGDNAQYTNYTFADVIGQWTAYESGQTTTRPTVPRPASLDSPTWAYKYDNNAYYGSALFAMSGTYYIVRSSGYSRFALDPLPANGATLDMTAILTKYCASSGRYVKYQLVLNRSEDVVVKK